MTWNKKTPIEELVETVLEDNQPYDVEWIKHVYRTQGYDGLINIAQTTVEGYAPADMVPKAVELAVIRIANAMKRAAFPNGTEELGKVEDDNGKITVKKLKEMYKEQFYDYEVYKPWATNNYPVEFCTDNCKWIDDSEYNDDTEIGLWKLMDEKAYQNSILDDTIEVADFEEWYGSENAKVLVMMLSENEVVRRYDK